MDRLPRQRIVDALARRNTGPVAVDLGGMESSGLTVGAYRRLVDHLGLELPPPRVMEVMQMVVLVDDALLDWAGADAACLIHEPTSWRPFTMPEGSPCMLPEGFAPEPAGDGGFVVRGSDGQPTARMPEGGFYFEPVNPALASVESVDELAGYAEVIHRFDRPTFCDESVEVFAKRARALHATGRAVVANLQCHLLAAGQILRGFERFMMDLVLEAALADALLETLTEEYLQRIELFLDAAGEHVDVVLFNDDLGTQAGPMLSPELYRKLIKPRQARMFDLVKRRYGKPVLFHSCGSVRRFIGDLIDAGVDALNPVQIGAAEMDPEELVDEFGRDLTFWGGGCDTQRVLASGSSDEVRDHVRRQMDVLNRRGGMVFAQVHNIQPDVPPANVAAMYEAVGRLPH